MPIGYLDVPTGVDFSGKRKLVKAMYEAPHEAWPFPDDVRIFLREWPLDSVSQKCSWFGKMMSIWRLHIPQGVNIDAKRKVLTRINEAVAAAYQLPDFMIFMQEYPLTSWRMTAAYHADNQQRVEDQRQAYS